MNIKRFFKMLVTNPNSPEGLRIRANKLVEEGASADNPYVKALRKMADIQKEKAG